MMLTFKELTLTFIVRYLILCVCENREKTKNLLLGYHIVRWIIIILKERAFRDNDLEPS